MHGKDFVQFLSLAALVSAGPVRKVAREVPQEHSHEAILTSVTNSLNLNNPDQIGDPVFALLGNAAAADGQGNIADVDCLQQATADQAFTNAKAAGDVQGMTDALIYRALERNSGSVGQKTAACTSIQAANPEIAALSQHQDPASDGAVAANKQVALDLATQIAGIGGDPQEALKSGTFAPGEIGDPTAAGNTCNDAEDADGCIFSQNLLVDDATAAEIDAAAGGAGAAGNAAAGADAGAVDAATAATADAAAADATAADAAGNAAATDAAAADATATDAADAAANAAATDVAATDTAAAVAAATDTATDAAAAATDAAAACGAAAANTATVDAAATAASASASASASVSVSASVTPSATAAAGDNAVVAVAARRILSRRFRKRQEALGSCATADPSIAFGVGFDGREDESFQPNDLETFNHGSAQNIGIVADFICGQLGSSCGANEDLVADCEDGAAAASQLESQDAADAFNAAIAV